MKKCVKCQTENPYDAKFCRMCGQIFEVNKENEKFSWKFSYKDILFVVGTILVAFLGEAIGVIPFFTVIPYWGICAYFYSKKNK